MSEIPQPEDINRLTRDELPRPDREALDHLTAAQRLRLILGNFLLAAAGNMVGGLGLVTLNRLTQGKQGERKRASA